MSQQPENLELVFRALTDELRRSGAESARSAAADAVTSSQNESDAALAKHAGQRTETHGISIGFFFAKTANPTGFPKWNEIEGRPTWIDQQIDPSTIEIDADQITTGVINIARLPVAAPGEVNAYKLVRADDPRLSVRTYSYIPSEPLAAGDFVSVYNVDEQVFCRRAQATDQRRQVIGFVADSWGTGVPATVYPTGHNMLAGFVEPLSPDYVGRQAFLSMAPGMATITPPELAAGAGIIQSLGTIVEVIGPNTAVVVVRYPFLVRL